MSNYKFPDKWCIVKYDRKLYKLLSTWMGGYASSDHWRLNSGITKIEVDETDPNILYVYGYSGSYYTVHIKNEGINMLGMGIFNQIKEVVLDAELISYEDWKLEQAEE